MTPYYMKIGIGSETLTIWMLHPTFRETFDTAAYNNGSRDFDEPFRDNANPLSPNRRTYSTTSAAKKRTQASVILAGWT